ncbi:MAG: hypothetical protein U5K75_12060 [Ahrensia sp.]|nr:hypothetical protein [Ahrensia sp.]
MSDFSGAIIAALAAFFVLIGFGVRQKSIGIEQERQRNAAQASKNYRAVRKAMDDAGNTGDDVNALRDRMRNRDPNTR